MCYSLFAALFSKTFLSHPPFKYPRSAPVITLQTLQINKPLLVISMAETHFKLEERSG